MAIYDLFSKRQKKLRGDVPDVFIYEAMPQTLRVQVVHIWTEVLGGVEEYFNTEYKSQRTYEAIVNVLCREYGIFQLVANKDIYGDRDYRTELMSFIVQEPNYEKVLDAVELSFQAIDRLTRDYNFRSRRNASEAADGAIEELNARFLEHGVGYRYEEGELLRIDSELVHAEVVKPALVLLRGSGYEGAQAEFLKAHEHYRHGRLKEALADCLKSLESVMKSICKKRNWQHPDNATSKVLIQTIFENGLVPQFWTTHFSGLRSTLEAGVPTARNKLGGHGQGSEVVEVPVHLVAYVLHQTAAAIVFLVEAEKSLA